MASRNRVLDFIIRHRFTIRDLGLLLLALLVAGYLAFEVDVFENESRETVHEETLELDESLALGGLLSLGLLAFAARKYFDQKRETERRAAAERQVRELAFQDGLTGLANRRQFEDALKAALAAPPAADATHALFLLDLNGFKQVNDVHGHAVGDELLVVVAQRLLSAMRDGDLVARFGGDEFAILSRHLLGAEAATSIALRVIQAFEAPIRTAKAIHAIGVGIGVALLPGDADTMGEALRKADVALYRAKAERRSALRFFETTMDERLRERDRIEQALREALATGAIVPLFQPSVDLDTGRITSFEVVPSWTHAEFGDVPPERFVPIAEEVGLIHDMSEALLRTACATATSWPPSITLAFNLFASQMKDRELAGRISRLLAETGFAPARLEIGITEATLVADMEAAQELLGGLRETGVSITLDNFGTGYSSLYHLRNFKLDKINIDRSFIETITIDRRNADIVGALVGLGHGLGLTVTAKGVADRQQQAALSASGVEQGQGAYYGRAISAGDTLAALA